MHISSIHHIYKRARCNSIHLRKNKEVRKSIVKAGSLTCKLEAGSVAQKRAPLVGGRALVYPCVLVPVQAANGQVAPRHVTPVVAPQINECSV